MEAYAVTFAKFLENDFKVQKCDELWFNLEEIENYLTEECMEMGNRGILTIKKSFRKNLKNRGICMRIDRKYNTVKIYKCERRKVKLR